MAAARRAAARAQFAALAALAVAALSVILSLVALADRPQSTTALPSTPAATAPPDDAAEGTEPDSEPTTTRPLDTRRVSPEADFQPKYEKQELRVQPPECATRSVDLHVPQVEAPRESAEFGYGDLDCDSSTKPQVDITGDSSISLVTSENATAKDCAEAIRTGPVNEPLVPTNQTRLCLITSAESAQAEGVDRLVALIVVTGIAQDGTMNVLVSAWTVPR